MQSFLKKIIPILVLLFILPRLATAAEKPEVFVQMGHSGDVNAVTVSTDGRYALSGSKDKTIKLWEVSTGREVRTFKGHSDEITSVDFSPDGRYALSGGRDRAVKLWDVSTGAEIRTFEGYCAAFSPDGRYLLSGNFDGIKLWEVSTGREVKMLKSNSAPKALSFSPDGRYALSGAFDTSGRNQLYCWEISTGKEIWSVKGHSWGVNSVAFSPDGKYALSGGGDGFARLWEIDTGREIRNFEYSSSVNSVAFSSNGQYAYSGGIGGGIKLWDVSTGKEIKTFKWGYGSSQILSLAVSPDGQYIFSGNEYNRYSDDDSTLRLIEVSTGKEVRKFQGHSRAVNSVAISPDGRYALSASRGRTVLWDMSTGRKMWKSDGGAISVAFSPDGQYAFAGVQILDASTGRQVRTIEGYPLGFAYFSQAFSPDGRYTLMGTNHAMFVVDVNTDRRVQTFEADGRSIAGFRSASFSPNGKYVLAHTYIGRPPLDTSQEITLLDVSAGRASRRFPIPGYVASIAFSPDARYALSVGRESVTLWDVSAGREVRAFPGHSPAAFSPDGRYALLGHKTDTMKLWDVSTGTEIKTLQSHSVEVDTVAFSPDGKYILSGSDNGEIKKWNIDTGNEMCTLVAFDDGEWIVITPDGFFNASPNGAKNLNVRIGNSVYGIDQFYARYYRPELVQLALAGKEIPKGETIGDILAKKPAPTVQIVSPASGSSVEKDSLTVSLKIKDNGGGIGNVMIYLNGAQVANETRGVIVKDKESTDEKILSFTIPLMEGQNEIRTIAFNKDNSMESNPAVVSVISMAVMQKPNLYALVIGINEYKNKSISLNYAVTDAKVFAETLKKMAAPLFEKTDIQVLTTPSATTREAITKAFEELRLKIKPNDLFVFYNASHGIVDVVDNEEQYFLLTSNVLFLRNIGKDAMSQKELAGLIGNIPAQKKVVILDTCNAGRGGKEIQVALLQQTRGLSDYTAVKLLHRAIGSAVFSASSDTQLALEGYKGHGLFTYVLIEGLQGKADVKKDGYITVLGLADYVEENVTKLSEEVFKRQQTPTIQTGANFPIGKVR
jgi:WD40 repeat protein